MASEDALEDHMRRDQPADDLVHSEQSDADRSVGDSSARINMAAFVVPPASSVCLRFSAASSFTFWKISNHLC